MYDHLLVNDSMQMMHRVQQLESQRPRGLLPTMDALGDDAGECDEGEEETEHPDSTVQMPPPPSPPRETPASPQSRDQRVTPSTVASLHSDKTQPLPENPDPVPVRAITPEKQNPGEHRIDGILSPDREDDDDREEEEEEGEEEGDAETASRSSREAEGLMRMQYLSDEGGESVDPKRRSVTPLPPRASKSPSPVPPAPHHRVSKSPSPVPSIRAPKSHAASSRGPKAHAASSRTPKAHAPSTRAPSPPPSVEPDRRRRSVPGSRTTRRSRASPPPPPRMNEAKEDMERQTLLRQLDLLRLGPGPPPPPPPGRAPPPHEIHAIDYPGRSRHPPGGMVIRPGRVWSSPRFEWVYFYFGDGWTKGAIFQCVLSCGYP